MRVPIRSGLFVTTLAAWAIAMVACGRAPISAPTPVASPAAKPPTSEAFVPGLGEIMSLQQMRHTKLWLAGQAANWQLANYEVDELGAGFDDVIKLHPTYKDAPVAPKDAIPVMMTVPLEDLRQAIKKQDTAAFATAYDTLTTACNNCHEGTNFGFNRVQRPTANPYPNQVFAPVPR